MDPQTVCNSVKKFISEAKLNDSIKTNVILPLDKNSVEPTLHTALTKDPNISTLLIKKSSPDDKLSLIIALRVKDEQTEGKSYSMVIANSNPAFYPEYVSLSVSPPTSSTKSIHCLNWEQIIKEVQESEDAAFSATDLESFLTSEDHKKHCHPCPYCQVPTAELRDLLDFNNNSGNTKIQFSSREVQSLYRSTPI